MQVIGGDRPPRESMVAGCIPAVVVTIALALVAVPGLATALTPAPSTAAGSDAHPIGRIGIVEAIAAAARGQILLVDVRPIGQRALGHVAGDVHVPLEQLTDRLATLPPNRRLVFYCSCPAEELALDAARTATQAGRPDVAVLVGGFDGWKAAGGPVLSDTPWEVVFRADVPPVGWGKTPVDSVRCSYARDDSVSRSGKSSGRIACAPGSDTRGFAGFTQRIAVGDLRGRTLTLSAMVRSEGVERMAFLWIAAEDSVGRMIPLSRPDNGPVAGNTDWHRVQVGGEVPQAAVRLLVGLSLATSGRVWIDDVQLVAEEQPGRPRLQVPVRNYGFER